MSKRTTDLLETEWAILRVVWREQPCAAPTVQEALAAEKDWTYGTVKTLMDRMVKKGLLTVKKVRNLYLYQSAITQLQAQKSEITRTLRRAFDGAMSPMMQLMLESETLSEEDYQLMERLIKNRVQR